MTALIWDLDGTLLDSYEAILDGIAETYDHYGLPFDRTRTRSYILQHSVQDLLDKAAAQYGLDAGEINAFRAQSLQEKNARIQLMEGAAEILAWARDQGLDQFVYTHKGPNAYPILTELGIVDYFREIITTANGFARKPHPAAVDYLVDKYQLDRRQTYYVGDRTLDVDLAANSGIHSINFCDYKPDFNQKIKKLADIRQLLTHEKAGCD